MSNNIISKQTIHTLVTILLMFGIGLLPPVSNLTTLGMQTLGILIGMIYGITFCSVAWPCLLGMVALIIWGIVPLGTVLSTGLGSDPVMLVLFFFIFVAILDQNKITEFLAVFMISRKFVQGKPWVFSYILIVGTMIAGALGSSYVAMIVFWGILISACNLYGLKPYSKYATVMFIGICIGGLASTSTWLFRSNPLYVNAMLGSLSNGTVSLNFGAYALYSFLIWMIVIAGYIVMCKYFLKVDIGSMKNIDDSVIDKSYLVLNRRQKVVFFYMILVIFVYCFTGFIPAGTPLAQYLSTFGSSGPILLILVLMSITKVDGEPIADLSAAAKSGVVWDTMFLSAALLGLSTVMSTSDTGISESIIAMLGPVFDGRSTIFMCIIICIVSIILTNFMSNTAVALMFTPVIFSFSQSLNFNPLPMIATMLIVVHIAYLTPGASVFAAMLFGNSSWVKPADIYKYGSVTLIWMFIIFLIVGIPLSNILM